ncbi:putative U3 small nucleolar ribonucleoprotein IMP4 [Blattamonas nauphoetae]|uniref:U3 small nucleolar ribonucleoprotein IMP4 n=1 Tax=Blattamonas nauphoetae TaxID=2049346 RepID=A0ABQ9YF97_9EUKA|nr:putative U3 small nucleolar ribonucleoprotein IMP4 [Blattamonas nauphoetae]
MTIPIEAAHRAVQRESMFLEEDHTHTVSSHQSFLQLRTRSRRQLLSERRAEKFVRQSVQLSSHFNQKGLTPSLSFTIPQMQQILKSTNADRTLATMLSQLSRAIQQTSQDVKELISEIPFDMYDDIYAILVHPPFHDIDDLQSDSAHIIANVIVDSPQYILHLRNLNKIPKLVQTLTPAHSGLSSYPENTLISIMYIFANLASDSNETREYLLECNVLDVLRRFFIQDPTISQFNETLTRFLSTMCRTSALPLQFHEHTRDIVIFFSKTLKTIPGKQFEDSLWGISYLTEESSILPLIKSADIIDKVLTGLLSINSQVQVASLRTCGNFIMRTDEYTSDLLARGFMMKLVPFLDPDIAESLQTEAAWILSNIYASDQDRSHFLYQLHIVPKLIGMYTVSQSIKTRQEIIHALCNIMGGDMDQVREVVRCKGILVIKDGLYAGSKTMKSVLRALEALLKASRELHATRKISITTIEETFYDHDIISKVEEELLRNNEATKEVAESVLNEYRLSMAHPSEETMETDMDIDYTSLQEPQFHVPAAGVTFPQDRLTSTPDRRLFGQMDANPFTPSFHHQIPTLVPMGQGSLTQLYNTCQQNFATNYTNAQRFKSVVTATPTDQLDRLKSGIAELKHFHENQKVECLKRIDDFSEQIEKQTIQAPNFLPLGFVQKLVSEFDENLIVSKQVEELLDSEMIYFVQESFRCACEIAQSRGEDTIDIRRNARLRRDYIHKKSLHQKEALSNQKKRQLKNAQIEGKPIPTELRHAEHQLSKEILLEDANTADTGLGVDDEYAAVGVEDPKIMITTSRDPSSRLLQFVKELDILIPNSYRINRGAHVVEELVEACRAAQVTDMIIVHEHRGEPDGLIICHLPYGPTAYFGLVNTVQRHDIETHANMPEAAPQLIFHNFKTPLGIRVRSILQALFPVPKPDSTRIVTFFNKDDYISFRHHSFRKDGKEVILNEIGPRFEMKLFQIKLGTIDIKDADTEFVLHPYMRSSRRAQLL